MGNLVKVTMNLTESDAAMAGDITSALQARSKASAVSFAIQLAWQIVKVLSRDRAARLLIERGDGAREFLVMPHMVEVDMEAKPARKD